MAAARRKIRPEDIHGLKYFKALQGLIERLHFVGTQRDKAGNRDLHMDRYCSLILLWFFSPIVDSLRGLQRQGGGRAQGREGSYWQPALLGGQRPQKLRSPRR